MADHEMREATASRWGFPPILFPPMLPPPSPSPPPQVPPRLQRRAPKEHTKEEWEAQRGIVEQMYITENKTLEEVTEFLKHNHGFYATVRQYKRRIKDWGLDTKYLKHCEMKAIVRKQRQRIAEGKKSVFEVKGLQVEPRKIERADKRYGNFNSPAALTPSDLVCYTLGSIVPLESEQKDHTRSGPNHRIQAGIYGPPSPAPFQNPSNPPSPYDHHANRSIPGTPEIPYLTNILNTATSDFTGESPAPIPTTPGPSAVQLVTARASRMDASTRDGDEGINGIFIEQFPLDFSGWFPCGTSTNLSSMDVDPDIAANMLDNQHSSSTGMPPPPRRRYKENEELEHKNKLQELESVHGLDHPATINTRLRLARVFRHQGRYRAAELAYRQAACTSQIYLGNNHESTFRAIHDLLYTFYYQGRYSTAETHYWSLRRRALNLLGLEHDTTMRISIGLATVLSKMGKWSEAESLEREVFEIQSRLYGLKDPATLVAMGLLAISLLNSNRFHEGGILLQEALRLEKEIDIDEYSILRGKYGLANMWQIQGRCEESEAMFKEVINQLSSLLGPEHPDTLRAMDGLAEVLDVQKRHAESRQVRFDVLAARLKVLGSSHPDTKRVQKALGLKS